MVRLVLAVAAVCAVTCADGASPPPKVTTQSGDLVGTKLKSYLGNPYSAFKGIPYAEPPVGEMRFRPPQPHRGWSGVRKATGYGSKCLQLDFIVTAGAVMGSEDCLFLNVFTPSLPEEEEHPQLPVMVWIHGGGFVSGAGDGDFYGPEYLMDQQVVLVTINYRLGPFGFLTTGDDNAPGNYGLHDQVLALEWVQANIEAFGGDPDAVTIFGESAGGASVSLQVLSPRSRGLFSRAISQSGASFCNFAASGEPQGENARRLAELSNCPAGGSREIVDCLRQKSAKDVLNAVATLAKEDPAATLPIFFKPRVDRESKLPFLPHDPYTALKNGQFNLVPWMTGLNQDEGAFFTFTLESKKEAVEVLRDRNFTRWASSILGIDSVAENPAAVAETVYRRYFGDASYGPETRHDLCDMLSDRWMTPCVVSEADLAAAHTPVYMYLLDHTGPGRISVLSMFAKLQGKPDTYRDLGVPHAEDLLYLFRQPFGPPVSPDSDEYKMIRFVMSVWTSFARQGYPSSDVLRTPGWPIYTASRQEYMRLNTEPSVGRAPFSERIQFWNELEIQENWRGPIYEESSHDEL